MPTDPHGATQAHRSEEEWRSLLEEILRRGLSIPQASVEDGINRQSLYHWRKKLAGEPAPAQFQEFTIACSPPKASIEIHCSNGTRMLWRDMSMGELANLIKTIEGGVSC